MHPLANVQEENRELRAKLNAANARIAELEAAERDHAAKPGHLAGEAARVKKTLDSYNKPS